MVDKAKVAKALRCVRDSGLSVTMFVNRLYKDSDGKEFTLLQRCISSLVQKATGKFECRENDVWDTIDTLLTKGGADPFLTHARTDTHTSSCAMEDAVELYRSESPVLRTHGVNLMGKFVKVKSSPVSEEVVTKKSCGFSSHRNTGAVVVIMVLSFVCEPQTDSAAVRTVLRKVLDALPLMPSDEVTRQLRRNVVDRHDDSLTEEGTAFQRSCDPGHDGVGEFESSRSIPGITEFETILFCVAGGHKT